MKGLFIVMGAALTSMYGVCLLVSVLEVSSLNQACKELIQASNNGSISVVVGSKTFSEYKRYSEASEKYCPQYTSEVNAVLQGM